LLRRTKQVISSSAQDMLHCNIAVQRCRVVRNPLRRQDRSLKAARSGPDMRQPLDAVALTLAIWLGVMVAVTGFVRLVDEATTVAEANRVAGIVPTAVGVPFYTMSFGG
jgi:hypothetical protein